MSTDSVLPDAAPDREADEPLDRRRDLQPPRQPLRRRIATQHDDAYLLAVLGTRGADHGAGCVRGLQSLDLPQRRLNTGVMVVGDELADQLRT